MKTKIFIILLLLSPLISNARLATEEDFSYIVQNTQTEIIINQDGSYETNETMTYKVLKDAAKDQLSLYKIQFDPSTEDVSIVEAYVENGSAKIIVDKSNIHNSSIAAKGLGLVSVSEIAIAFSQIKPGSLVYIKCKVKNKIGVFGKYFTHNITYGSRYLEMQNSLKITSPRPLFFKSSDPTKVLTISQHKIKDGPYLLEAQMKGPYVNIAVQENGTIPKTDYTTLTISNLETWPKLRKFINSRIVLPQQKETLPQPLLQALSSIAPEATFEKKVDTILSYITSEYDYLGDWRGAGKYIPKPIDKIVADRFGDCKDFSNLLLRMLQHLGIKADYALVERSYDPQLISEENMPSHEYFNHMIVRVENEGKTYWIDPTNKYSIGLNTRNDINERNALVLGKNKNILEKIEKTNSTKDLLFNSKNYVFSSADEASVDAHFKMGGEISRLILDGLKGKSKVEFQDAMLKMIARNEHTVVSSFNSLDTKEKAYYDLNIKTKYIANKIAQKDGHSPENFIVLPNIDIIAVLGNFRKSNVGSLSLQLIPNIKNEYFYKNIFLAGSSPRVCDIKSEWLDATRKIEKRADGIILNDEVIIKKPQLTPDDYNHKGFEAIIGDAARCFLSNNLQYNFGTKKHYDRISQFELTLSKLSPAQKILSRIEKAGKILDNRSEAKTNESYTSEDARLMMEQNLAEAPHDSETLRILGAYFANNSLIVGNDREQNSLKRALFYLDESLAADKNNKSAQIDKVGVFMDMQQLSAAKDILYKEILIWDKSKLSHRQTRKIMYSLYQLNDKSQADLYYDLALKLAVTNLEKAKVMSRRAFYLLGINQYSECVKQYKQALTYYDKEAWDHGNLSICYLWNNQTDLAIESSKKALSIMDYGAAHSVLADAYIKKGQEYTSKYMLTEAIEYYNLAALEFPGVDPYLGLADLYLRQRKIEKAKEAASKSLAYTDARTTPKIVEERLKEIFARANVAYP